MMHHKQGRAGAGRWGMMAVAAALAFGACDVEEPEDASTFDVRAGGCGDDAAPAVELYTEANPEDLFQIELIHSGTDWFSDEPRCLIGCRCWFHPVEPVCADGSDPLWYSGAWFDFWELHYSSASASQVDLTQCDDLAEHHDDAAMTVCIDACAEQVPQLQTMTCCEPLGPPPPPLLACFDMAGNPIACVADSGSGSGSGSGAGSGSGTGSGSGSGS
ncbi:MAG: hypothetical protein K0V04_06330 [Deltaproteobacteria bacterium]|nr:hypothetical protein [Deltaproteobacteria bacterium]